MRKQYYFRNSNRELMARNVDRLVELSSTLQRRRVSLSDIKELDEVWFGDDQQQTLRSMIEHLKLIQEADHAFPIILSASGSVIDGLHRVAKAVLQGSQQIEAVQFAEDPEPDYVGRGPNELPY